MTYASLFNAEAVAIAKEHHAQFGDEIGSTFLGVQCKEFRDKFKSKELAIWLFSMEDKRKIVDEVFGKFHEVFGFYPTSTGSYYMDAEYRQLHQRNISDGQGGGGDCCGRKVRKRIGMRITPGTRCWMVVHGIREFPPGATSTALHRMKTMILESLPSLISRVI